MHDESEALKGMDLIVEENPSLIFLNKLFLYSLSIQYNKTQKNIIIVASIQFRGHIVIKVGLMGCFERGVECGVMDWEVN